MTGRPVFAAAALLAAAALAGCASYSQTAMQAGGDRQRMAEIYLDGSNPEQQPRQPRRAAQKAPAPKEDKDDKAGLDTVGMSSQKAAPTAYSDEWNAKEEAEDARLKQKMNICRGC